MSDSLASLRRKIGGADDLKSVVRSMKALAASSIGQYERSVLALADYDRTVQLGLATCFRNREHAANHTSYQGMKQTAVSAIVFGSDQGLVGQFNEVLADFAAVTLKPFSPETRVWAVGERVQSRLADHGLQPEGLFNVPNSVNAITPLVGRILIDTEAQNPAAPVQRLFIFHNRPRSRASYDPVSQLLLPLDDAWAERLTRLPWPSGNLPQVAGNPNETLRALIGEYLFVSLFKACAESLAAENASRLVAMQRAEKNIDELVERLTRTSQLMRQNSIDEELFDVVSGYESLLNHPPRGEQ